MCVANLPSLIASGVSPRRLDANLTDGFQRTVAVKAIRRYRERLVEMRQTAQVFGWIHASDRARVHVCDNNVAAWHYLAKCKHAYVRISDMDRPPVPVIGLDLQIENELLVGRQYSAHIH